jgi:HK97 family phage portal protein
MKFFGRKSAGRGVSRPALLRGWSSWGAGGEIPRSYEDRVREGYVNNPVAQRAVRLVAEGVGSAPVSASDPAVLPLLHAKTAGQGLVETVAMQLLLHGNAYVQVLTGADGAPVELFALRPERVTIEADARGWPVAFLYKAGEATMRIAAEDAAGRPAVIHIKTANPLDDHYGLGCLGAAAGAVAIHNAATKWNKALLDNAARPSGAMVYEPGEPGAALSAEQFERLRTELDNSFSGADNAGRPMLLEGGLRWQAMSLTPADMDFVGLKAASAREIALAFGVPPMLLGLPGDAGYANYREANKALWRLAILPVAATVLGGIADGLKGWLPSLSLTVDLDQVPALSEERERLWGQVTAADFLTREEKRAMLGLGKINEAPAFDPSTVELKFNPYHDPTNGRFTFKGGDAQVGSETDEAAMAKPPARDKFRPGGGSFGGGGASGKWEPASPRRASVPPKRDLPVAPTRTAKAAKQGTGRVVSSGRYGFETDASGRTIRVLGVLRLQPEQGRSRRNQRDAGKPDRMDTDHGGHFIAREFGGPEIALNHFAQDARSNRSEYRKLELSWKADLKRGRKVSVSIRPSYIGRSRRPESLRVTFYVNGLRRVERIQNGRGGK